MTSEPIGGPRPNITCIHSIASADRLGGFERPAAGEHRESLKNPLLRIGQQLVAPVNGGAQRLLTRQRCAVPARQESEALIETACQLIGAQGVQTRRG